MPPLHHGVHPIRGRRDHSRALRFSTARLLRGEGVFSKVFICSGSSFPSRTFLGEQRLACAVFSSLILLVMPAHWIESSPVGLLVTAWGRVRLPVRARVCVCVCESLNNSHTDASAAATTGPSLAFLPLLPVLSADLSRTTATLGASPAAVFVYSDIFSLYYLRFSGTYVKKRYDELQ